MSFAENETVAFLPSWILRVDTQRPTVQHGQDIDLAETGSDVRTASTIGHRQNVQANPPCQLDGIRFTGIHVGRASPAKVYITVRHAWLHREDRLVVGMLLRLRLLTVRLSQSNPARLGYRSFESCIHARHDGLCGDIAAGDDISHAILCRYAIHQSRNSMICRYFAIGYRRFEKGELQIP